LWRMPDGSWRTCVPPWGDTLGRGTGGTEIALLGEMPKSSHTRAFSLPLTVPVMADAEGIPDGPA